MNETNKVTATPWRAVPAEELMECGLLLIETPDRKETIGKVFEPGDQKLIVQCVNGCAEAGVADASALPALLEATRALSEHVNTLGPEWMKLSALNNNVRDAYARLTGKRL